MDNLNLEEVRDWLGAVEFLVTEKDGAYVENATSECVRVENVCGGRYAKYNCEGEFIGLTDDVVEAVMWLIEMEDN